jgi:hypothetical protein
VFSFAECDEMRALSPVGGEFAVGGNSRRFATRQSCACRPSWSRPSMRELVILAIHLLATLGKLLGPGGVRAVAAESLVLKHQLLIANRSRCEHQISPRLIA